MALENKQLVYLSSDGGEAKTHQINEAVYTMPLVGKFLMLFGLCQNKSLDTNAKVGSRQKGQAVKSDYSYSHLPEGYIRLLRLLPHRDKTAPIHCDIFCYPLLELAGSTPHLYSALSYVWGCPEKTQYISIGSRNLSITANLHAALSRLRDNFLERILWVDAICIDQGNLRERGIQVQSMAMIYNMASCVVVWLGESESNSDRAIEEINKAAAGKHIEDNQTVHQAVFQLLQREWFKRIWVRDELCKKVVFT